MTKCVVITGASSGIGQALAIGFANSGYTVLAIGRNEVNLKKIKLFTKNGNLTTIVADLSEDIAVGEIAKNIILQNGIQYVIHCAAVTEPHKPLMSVSRAELKKIIDVNVMAPIFLTQKLAPYFDEMTRVLFIGSDYVGIDKKLRPHISGSYAISKTALMAAVKYLKLESDKALIGCLNPGSTDTPMYKSMMVALNQQGIFNNAGQPTHPKNIAAFIQAVLEKTSNQDYRTIDWDFRNITHHQLITTPQKRMLSLNTQAKL